MADKDEKIVRTHKFKIQNVEIIGYVMDTPYLHAPAEEIERRINLMKQIASDILNNAERRKLEEKKRTTAQRIG